MKMVLMLGLVLFALPLGAAEFQILVNMPEGEAKASLKVLGKDVTEKMDETQKTEKGLYWECKEYKSGLALEYKEGKVSRITYWHLKDFVKDKDKRTVGEYATNSVTFNTTRMTCRPDK